MKQSRIPLYAFVDETGNTGHNVFDNDQPDFFSGALISRGNFDESARYAVKEIAAKVGADELHGNVMGIHVIESISSDILSLLKRSKPSFFVSRVEKKYLLVCKIFDSLFDSGENAAISWHHYNIRPLRIILVFKLSNVLDEETCRAFWNCLLETSETRAKRKLLEVASRIKGLLTRMTDARAQAVLREGLEWVEAHPEAIQIAQDVNFAKQGHFPNMVAFVNLLAGLHSLSDGWSRPVARVTHDRQSEFEKTMKIWHSMYANASPQTLKWAGEEYQLQKLPNSEFCISEDNHSAGIQIVDVVLWLFKQAQGGRELPQGCQEIISYVMENGWQSDFSFRGVSRQLTESYGSRAFTPLPPEREEFAKLYLEKAEEHRQQSMRQYEADKVPPFMRSFSQSQEGAG